MNKRKVIGFTGAALTAAFALVANEWTGYRIFDRVQGGNILCSADPSCRNLTFGEVRMAKTVFGDRINYNSVKIFSRKFMYVVGEDRCTLTPNGNIYLSDDRLKEKDFSLPDANQEHLIHELEHVLQDQRGRDVPGEAMASWMDNALDYKSAYSYDAGENTSFQKLNLEQQAVMVADYFKARKAVQALEVAKAPPTQIAQSCQILLPLESKLLSVLPIHKEAVCAPVKIPPFHPRKAGKSHPVAVPASTPVPSFPKVSFCG